MNPQSKPDLDVTYTRSTKAPFHTRTLFQPDRRRLLAMSSPVIANSTQRHRSVHGTAIAAKVNGHMPPPSARGAQDDRAPLGESSAIVVRPSGAVVLKRATVHELHICLRVQLYPNTVTCRQVELIVQKFHGHSRISIFILPSSRLNRSISRSHSAMSLRKANVSKTVPHRQRLPCRFQTRTALVIFEPHSGHAMVRRSLSRWLIC